MTIGLTWRRTARRIKRLKEAVLTTSLQPTRSPDPRLFGALHDRGFHVKQVLRSAGQEPKSLSRYGAFLLVPVFRDPDFGDVLTPNFRAVL